MAQKGKAKGGLPRQSPRLTREVDMDTDSESVLDTTLDSEAQDESMYMSVLEGSGDSDHDNTFVEEKTDENLESTAIKTTDKTIEKTTGETSEKTTEKTSEKNTDKTPEKTKVTMQKTTEKNNDKAPVRPTETEKEKKAATKPQTNIQKKKIEGKTETAKQGSTKNNQGDKDNNKDSEKETEKSNPGPDTNRPARNRRDINYAEIHNGRGNRRELKPNNDTKEKPKDKKRESTKDNDTKKNPTKETTKESEITQGLETKKGQESNKEKQGVEDNTQQKSMVEQQAEEIKNLKMKLSIAEQSRTKNIAEKIQAQQEARQKEKERARLENLLDVKEQIRSDLHNQSITKGKLLKEANAELIQVKGQLEAKENEIKRLRTRNDERIAEMLEQTDKEKREIINDWQNRYDALERDNIEMRKRLMTIEKLNRALYQKIKKQEDQQETTQEEESDTESTSKNILIMDSNRKHVSNYLDRTKEDWIIEREIYTIRQLEEYVTKNNTTLKMKDNIVIGIGLNDLRNRIGGIEAYERLKAVVSQLETRDNRILVLEITPVRDSARRLEIEITNACLRADKEVESIQLPQCIEESEIEQIVMDDGFHITEKVAEIIADQISLTLNQQDKENKTIEKNTEKTKDQQSRSKTKDKTPGRQVIVKNTKTPSKEERTKPQNTVEINFEIPSRMGPHLVGNEGRNIRKIEREFRVKLSTKKSEGSHQTVWIMGDRKDVDRAKEEISKQLDGRTEHDRVTREYRENTACYYYQRGWCKHGDMCEFTHEDRHNSRDRERNRSRTRSNREESYRSRSPREEREYRQRSRSRGRREWGDEPEYEYTHYNR